METKLLKFESDCQTILATIYANHCKFLHICDTICDTILLTELTTINTF